MLPRFPWWGSHAASRKSGIAEYSGWLIKGCSEHPRAELFLVIKTGAQKRHANLFRVFVLFQGQFDNV